MSIRMIRTEDGSHSLFDVSLNESYHSRRGAIGESMYVFIEKGFLDYLGFNATDRISIFEVGFGTGLNALLTANDSQGLGLEVVYHTIEVRPLPEEIYTLLNYGSNPYEEGLLNSFHRVSWERDHRILDRFVFRKMGVSLIDFVTDFSYDIIYFDAFAPSKQPALWTKEVLTKCFNVLNAGGILVTYCAQGEFKRHLKAIGFEVERLCGALGKKEMVRARRP